MSTSSSVTPRTTLSPTYTHRLRHALCVVAVGAVVMTTACSDQQEPPAPAPAASVSPTVPPSSKPTPSVRRTDAAKAVNPLTGGKPSDHGVFAVKIENTAAARPQVGLRSADIVVVEEVEAQITRMIGVFHTGFPVRVGPVRSARNTDAELLPLFGKPGLVYSGANRKVQRKLREASLVPIERSDRDHRRIAPHNVFVDVDALARKTKVGKAQDIGLVFADADPRWKAAPRQDQVAIKVGMDTTSFRYRDGAYAVSWNANANLDGDTGQAVTTDNVIVMNVKNRRDTDSTSDISVVSETVGSGEVTLYRDGKRLSGTWSRTKVDSELHFRDTGEKDIPLKPGTSWLLLRG